MKKTTFLYTFFPLLSFLLVSIGFFNTNNNLYSIIFITLFTFTFFKYILIDVETKIMYIFIIAFLIRLCMIFIDVNISEIDPGDSRAYRMGAENFFYTNNATYKGRVDHSGTILFMGIIDKIFGPHRVTIQYFNTFFFMNSAYFTHKTLSNFSVPTKIKYFLLIWMLFSPQSIKTSSASCREGFISFFVAFSVYSFCMFIKYKNKKKLIFSFASVILGCILHSGVIALLGGYIFHMVMYDNKNENYKFSVKSIIIIFSIILFLVPIFFIFGNSMFTKFAYVNDIEDITNRGTTFSGGGSDYVVPFGDSIIGTPFRALYFQLVPLPWHWRNLVDICVFILLSLPHIFIMKLYFQNIKYISIMRRKICHLLIFSAVCISIVFGWGCRNVGTAIRHRDKFTPIYVCLLGLLIAPKEKTKIIYSI